MSAVESDGQPHAYFQAIINAYAAAGRPFFHQVTPGEAREMLRASMMAAPSPVDIPALAEVRDERIGVSGGLIAVRRYIPHGKLQGTGVYLHAGGWVIGDLSTGDALCRRLAVAGQCEIVSVDYRLAPEHRFPIPLDDAFAALEWAADHCTGPLIVIGESAGANLAAACAIRVRDAGGPPLAGQFLAYPVTDAGMATDSYREIGDRNWLLSANDMRWFWDHYCPSHADRANPLAAPLRLADPAGLPPTLIFVGELDPLRDEGLAFARALADAAVPVETRCDAAMLHGYLSAAGAVPVAAQAVARGAEWLRERFDEAGNTQ